MNCILPLVCILVLSGIAKSSKASHAMGADLTYTCLGGSTYEIRLTLYRDCVGISMPSEVSVDVSSLSCGMDFGLSLLPDTLFTGLDTFMFGEEISPICIPWLELYGSTCGTGVAPGVEVYSYSRIINMPMPCPDWKISYFLCCRNEAIDNLLFPGSQRLYVEANIDAIAGGCNSSVKFTQLPVTYICNNQPFSFNHGAIDPEGDSLVYTLINPLTTMASPISFAPGFSLEVPVFTTDGAFDLDPISGQLSFTPGAEQFSVVTIRIDEYRDGVWIGNTMRDMQIVVTDCPGNFNPQQLGTFHALEGAVALDENSLRSCPGDTISFVLQFDDLNPADILSLSTTLPLVLPGASLSISGSNPISLNVSWATTPADTGFFPFTVSVQDDACPVFSNQVFAFDIQLLSGLRAGPDGVYCPGGIPFQLSASSGGSMFNWTPAAGLNDPGLQNPLASPAVSTLYIVSSDLPPQCKNQDSVLISVVPPFSYTLSPGDTLCRFDPALLIAQPDPSQGPYLYQWQPIDGLSQPDSAMTAASPEESTWYQIFMESASGCRMLDSIPLVIKGTTPLWAIASDKTLLCPGTSAQFDLTPSCGSDAPPCPALSDVQIGSGSLSTDGPTPFKGSYSDARIQILYTAEDLRESGFYGGVIEEISLLVTDKNSSLNYRNFSISLSCFSAAELGVSFEEGTQPFWGPANYSSIAGWNTFSLDRTFAWSGDEGILLEICFDNLDGAYSSDDAVAYTLASYPSTLVDVALSGSGCSLNASPTLSNRRANLRLGYCRPDIPAVDISWTPATGLSDPGIQQPIASPLSGPVTYTVVLDDNGCSSSDSLTLDVDASLLLDAGEDQFICLGESAALNALALGPEPPGGFLFQWSPLPGLSNPAIADPTASPLLSSLYTVSTLSINNCPYQDSVWIEVLTFNATISEDGSICAGDELLLEVDGGLNVSWTPAEGLSCIDCSSTLASPGSSTLYTAVASDMNACQDTLRVRVIVQPLPYLELFSDTTIFQGERAQLSSSEGLSYLWSPSTGLSHPESQFTEAAPEESTTYTMTLTDANGCKSSRDLTVTVLELLDIFLPNAFSPNGDGNNDVLIPISRGLAQLDEFSIYNRWGEMLFSTTRLEEGWDGTYLGVEQEVGTYLAVLRAQSLTGRALQKNQAVQLVR